MKNESFYSLVKQIFIYFKVLNVFISIALPAFQPSTGAFLGIASEKEILQFLFNNLYDVKSMSLQLDLSL